MARKKKDTSPTIPPTASAADVAAHHAAAREFLSDEFVTGREADHFDARAALSAILTGIQRNSDELAALKQRMEVYDQQAARYEADRQKFIEEVLDQASDLKATGDRRERIKAGGVKQLEQEIKQVNARNASDRLRFEQALAEMPKVKIAHPGRVQMRSVNGLPHPELVPLVIRIKHRVWTLPPGQEIEVPEIVAQRVREIMRSTEETNERKKVLAVDGDFTRSADKQDLVIAQKLAEIDKRYNTPTLSAFPLASS